MGVAEKVKAKATAYFEEQPELVGESPSTLLVDFVIEKYKDLRNYPSSFSDVKIEKDIEKHISTIAMAVVDLKMKEACCLSSSLSLLYFFLSFSCPVI